MASIRNKKPAVLTVAEIDAVVRRARLVVDASTSAQGASALVGGDAPPPLIRGGTHIKLTPQLVIDELPDSVPRGGYLVLSDDGAKYVPIQKAVNGEKCVIDYCSFTFAEKALSRVAPEEKPFTDLEHAETVARFVGERLLGIKAQIDHTFAKGLFGYRVAVRLGQYATVAAGGNNDSILVQIGGAGLAVADSEAIKRIAQFIQGIPSAHLTRVDIAYDDYEGKLFPVRNIRERWNAGEFSAQNARVLPKYQEVGDWARGDLEQAGLTVYIGAAKSGKLVRIYEKGRQLGDKTSPFVRAEVELRNSVYQLVPAMLLRPSGYMVMMCPAFACIAYAGDTVRSDRQGKEALATVERVIENIKIQYGAYLHVLRKEFFATDAELLAAVCRAGRVPDVLEKAIRLSDAALNAVAGDRPLGVNQEEMQNEIH